MNKDELLVTLKMLNIYYLIAIDCDKSEFVSISFPNSDMKEFILKLLDSNNYDWLYLDNYKDSIYIKI